jgi:CRP-like cAMP-binding protein
MTVLRGDHDMRPHRFRQPATEGIYHPSIFAMPVGPNTNGSRVELLSSEEQRSLAAISQVIEVEPNTVLYPESGRADFAYNIVDGAAQTYRLLSDGNRQITAFFFPSDMLGLSEKGAYLSTAQSITTVVAYKIPIAPLLDLLERDIRLNASLLAKVIQDLRDARNHAAIMGKKEASARLAAFLLWLGRVRPGSGPSSRCLSLPMTRYDIADYLGLSSESVSRALGILENRGAIERNGGRSLCILDEGLLGQLAGNG